MRSSIVLILLASAACSASMEPAAPNPPPATAPPPAAPTAPPVPQPTTPAAPLRPAPWSAAAVGWADLPRAYRTTWEAAENRATCAAIAPARAPSPEGTPRTAYFGGGWGVAYDLPETRSAYGVAGTGASATGDLYTGFPNRIEWSDGSIARYGPEGGGAGPNQLAYLTIPGQACLYNIWSRVGIAHLEELLSSLRFVR